MTGRKPSYPGFMDLPAELRLIIHGYILTSSRIECSNNGWQLTTFHHCCSEDTDHRRHPWNDRTPTVCASVETAILRVCRQVHCEAQSILLDSMEYTVYGGSRRPRT